jgi:hypothetical protein
MTTVVPTFSGHVGDTVNSGDFLKAFRNTMRERKVTDDGEKIETFGDYLKGGSPAEEWFEDEGKGNTTWTDFQTAFTTRFPAITRAKKSQSELERELQALRLPMKKLGKTEFYGGEEVYTHIVFAEKALDLAKRVKIATTTHLIWQVRDQLPDVVKEKINETQQNWTTFHKAMVDLPLGHIREGIAKHEKNCAEKDEITRRLAMIENAQLHAPASPTKVIRQQMERTTIASPQAPTYQQATTPQHNPFTSQFGGRGNLPFQQSTRPRYVPTEASRTKVLTRLSEYPMQPPTEEGRVKHRKQCQEWIEKYTEHQRVTEDTGFPATPGTAPPGSGECYACGRAGHESRNCTAARNECVSEKERLWRAICGSVLGRRTPRMTNMNYVAPGEPDEFAWMNTYGADLLGNQGKGMGPTM